MIKIAVSFSGAEKIGVIKIKQEYMDEKNDADPMEDTSEFNEVDMVGYESSSQVMAIDEVFEEVIEAEPVETVSEDDSYELSAVDDLEDAGKRLVYHGPVPSETNETRLLVRYY